MILKWGFTVLWIQHLLLHWRIVMVSCFNAWGNEDMTKQFQDVMVYVWRFSKNTYPSYYIYSICLTIGFSFFSWYNLIWSMMYENLILNENKQLVPWYYLMVTYTTKNKLSFTLYLMKNKHILLFWSLKVWMRRSSLCVTH